MNQSRLIPTFALVTALVLGAAPWVAAQQEPECVPVVTLQIPDQCVAPGLAFQAVDLQALFDQQYPGHPAVSAWTISSESSPPPPDVTIDAGTATITYPTDFVGCREVQFLAWKDICGSDFVQARGSATFSVAPSPVILAIPPQHSDPQATTCDTVLLDLDAYLAGGVDPADIVWTAEGQQALQVTIDPNTHVATVTNTSDSCAAVSEPITFRACVAGADNHAPDCVECPRYCWDCAETTVTFTLICDADGDGVADRCDICPGYDDALDDDNDGVPDGCDICPGYDDALDDDNDGVPDGCDICPGYDDALDDDNDGVPDGCDACPGYDDALDADNDGVPDGCDCCPDGDDNLDTDGDGVPDACDVCEGYDDTADADSDGIPDGCDQDPGPQPVPQPCPECPDSIETVAVGWFCPAAATVVLVVLGAGVFLTSGYGRRW